MIGLMNLHQFGFLPGPDLLLDLHGDGGVNLGVVLHLLLPGSSVGLLQPRRGRFNQGQISLHLLDILRLLDLLSSFHPLEDMVSLPLVLDLFNFLNNTNVDLLPSVNYNSLD